MESDHAVGRTGGVAEGEGGEAGACGVRDENNTKKKKKVKRY
jgi:hypothetical protein